MLSDIYEMEISGVDENGMPFSRSIPVYTCGHCSSVVALRKDRTRPRNDCLTCGRIICEKSEICNTHCTPIHKLANNGDMQHPRFGKFIPAIMAGVTDVGEAEKKGLIIT